MIRTTTSALIILIVAAFSLGGCAFGTNYVNLPTTVAGPLPASGDHVVVQVTDARSDLSGAEVGFKRNGYGAKTGSVELSGKEILADRLARDVVALLRERGYRAYEAKDLAAAQAEIAFGTEIASFSVDVKHGFWSGTLQGNAVLRVRVMDKTRRIVWEALIRATREKGVMTVVESDHQEIVEGLYKELLLRLRGELPAQFPR